MPREAQALASAYGSKVKNLEQTRQKVERLYSESRMTRRDIEQVYESLFLSSITAFEALLEDLFFGLMMGRLKSRVPGVRCKISISSEVVAREVTLAGHNYLDWFPYSRTEERARMYFASGLPFLTLDDSDKSVLQQCLYIRNAITHKSRFAIETYKSKVIGTMRLPPRERGPASYLRSLFRTSPDQRRYENYTARLIQVALKLCR